MAVGSQTQQITSVRNPADRNQYFDRGTIVTQQQMRDLPLNGRNPLQLTTLTAGTVLTTSAPRAARKTTLACRSTD